MLTITFMCFCGPHCKMLKNTEFLYFVLARNTKTVFSNCDFFDQTTDFFAYRIGLIVSKRMALSLIEKLPHDVEFSCGVKYVTT